ncbi:MAG: hypothetical protein ABIB61_03060 [Candidatus Shapirobacteria bacterium]
MEAKNSSPKSKAQKRSLISAIIGVSIAIFTFICCGLLIPLGLIGAAVFLHQYRIPLIVLGVAIAGVSIFFALRGKEIICLCKIPELVKKYRKIIILLGILIFVGTGIFLIRNFLVTPTQDLSNTNQLESIKSEWKSNKVDPDLVDLINFLEGNIGKEIELAGEKQIITGNEGLSIKIKMLECCTKREFAEILDLISKTGRVIDSDFSQKKIIGELPANEIPKVAEIWNVERIDLEQKSKDMYSALKK